ncbi:MAG: hypothetical protein ACI4O7_09110 [Aristaeellaceae bacterium]
MSDFMLCLLILLVSTVVGPLIVRLRNSSYEDSAASEDARQSLEELARTALAEDETLLLSDYAHLSDACILMTDKGFHFRQKKLSREIAVDAAYRQIMSCTFRDYGGQKTRNTALVHNIQLHTINGDCTLSCFPREAEIAAMLIERGW